MPPQRLNIKPATPAAVAEAAKLIAEGGLVAFPTETVYGLGANALDGAAVARIFAAKARPGFNPLIVHLAGPGEARDLARFNGAANCLADRFWPGPLTLVLARLPGCPVSKLASAGLATVALRVPAHGIAKALLEQAGVPVVAPSANPSGAISPTRAGHVAKQLGAKVDMILDGGPTALGLESTVVGFETQGAAVLLRPGGLPAEEIEAALGSRLSVAREGPRPSAPGQLQSHYAPVAPVRLAATTVRPGEALLAFGPTPPAGGLARRNLSPSGDLAEAAANFFAMLHELDACGPDSIAAMAIPDRGLGRALNDRLRRAAAPRS